MHEDITIVNIHMNFQLIIQLFQVPLAFYGHERGIETIKLQPGILGDFSPVKQVGNKMNDIKKDLVQERIL